MYIGMDVIPEHVVYRRGGIEFPVNELIGSTPVTSDTLGWVALEIGNPANGDYDPVRTELCLNGPNNNVQGAGVGNPVYRAGRNIQIAREIQPGFPGGAAMPPSSFNQLLTFSETQSNSDINHVLAHEVGHVLGLKHPSTGAFSIRSLMQAKAAWSGNFQGSLFDKRNNRKAQPYPIDSKNNIGGDEVDSELYTKVKSYNVPIMLHNKGTTERWTAGLVRFKKVNISEYGSAESFGAQMPPRSTVRLIRWIDKPSPANSATAGVYEIETFLNTPHVSSMSSQQPLRFNYRSQSGKQFSFF